MDRLIQASVQGDKSLLLSEHKAEQDLRFPNSINIEIMNVSCEDTALFGNNLPEGAPIPGIEQDQDQISVIYIYFPLGDGDAYLTTEEWASKMIAYAPFNWAIERAFDAELYGVYFKLYPLYPYELAPQDRFYLSIANLITFGELEKMVYVAVKVPAVAMSSAILDREATDESIMAGGTDFLAYFKKRAPLQILNLACTRTRVAVGDSIQVQWAVAGDVEKCVLTPGDFVVESVGTREFEIFEDTTFRLYAFGEDQQMSRSIKVYVEAPVITQFTSDCPNNETPYGKSVTLSYASKNGGALYLNQGIGEVFGRSISVLPDRASTVYTLSGMDTEQLVQANLTISVTDFLEVNRVIYYRVGNSPETYRYYLIWKVSNCLTIQWITSDGQVRSSGQSSGSLKFTDPSTTPLAITLDCTGTSGQVIHQEYSA